MAETSQEQEKKRLKYKAEQIDSKLDAVGTLVTDVGKLKTQVGDIALKVVENSDAYDAMVENNTVDNNTLYFVKD